MVSIWARLKKQEVISVGLGFRMEIWKRRKTNLVKAKIDKSQGDSLCRVCRKVDESIDHIVSGFSKLAQKEYKIKHDNLGKIVHWKLARK